MKTNITKLSNDKFGVLVDTAMFCSYGTCTEDADYDICNIYELVGGGYIAEAYGVLFSVEETNWCGTPRKYREQRKRGQHSSSNNKVSYRAKLWDMACAELPF